MNTVPHLMDHIDFDTTFLVFDLLAVFMFAASGALTAIRKKYDFIGVFMLSFVSGLGGGLIRDAIFIQAGPPKAVTDSKYLLVILGAFVLSLIFHGSMHRLKRTVILVDALGLGAYGVVGAEAALQEGLVPLAAVLVGIFNACGAGLIRDVLIREEPIIFKPGQFYAAAAILGCGIFVGMVELGHADHTLAAILATLTVFLVRILSIYFDWQTRPVLDEDDRS